MKKLMILGAVALMAAASQAALFDWTLESDSFLWADGSDAYGKTVYLLEGANAAYFTALYADLAAGEKTFAEVAANGFEAETEAEGKSAGEIDGTASETDFVADNVFKQYALFAYEDDKFILSYDVEGKAYDGVVVEEGQAANFFADQFAGEDGVRGGWTTAASTTPEPTSGLLLLLGVAGLALRRRRA